MRNEGYDIAQICLNGHVINSLAQSAPNHNKNFCDDCGAETITKCPSCNQFIKGTYHYPGSFVFGEDFEASKFCDNCGKMYPWTETQIQVAAELIELAEKLTPNEKIDFNSNILELIKETPKVPIAQIKVKRIMDKIDKNISSSIHDALESIISQTIQDNIW